MVGGDFRLCWFDADGLYDGAYHETPITFGGDEPEIGSWPYIVRVVYGEASLSDRTMNRLSVDTFLDELSLAFPASTGGKARDFGLRVVVGPRLAAPALVFPSGLSVETFNGGIPTLARGTGAQGKGITLLYFTETAPDVFLVKGEHVKEV